MPINRRTRRVIKAVAGTAAVGGALGPVAVPALLHILGAGAGAHVVGTVAAGIHVGFFKVAAGSAFVAAHSITTGAAAYLVAAVVGAGVGAGAGAAAAGATTPRAVPDDEDLMEDQATTSVVGQSVLGASPTADIVSTSPNIRTPGDGKMFLI